MEDHDLRLLLSSLIKLKRSGATCTMQVETLKGQARATLTLSPRTPTTTSLEPGPPSSSRTGATVPPLFPHPPPHHLPREGGRRQHRRRGPSALRRDAARRQAWLAARQAPAPPADPALPLQATATEAPLPKNPTMASLVLPSLSTLSTSLPNLPTSHAMATMVPLPSITVTPAFKVLSTSTSLLTTVGGRRDSTKKRGRATIVDAPPLFDSTLPQLDGQQEKEQEEVKEREKELIGPQPPTYDEIAGGYSSCACSVCGEEMFWVKTVPLDIYWDHLFICNKKCEPILLQTT